jgi:signal transduction histidine kinase
MPQLYEHFPMKTLSLTLILCYFLSFSSFSQTNKVVDDLNNQLQNHPKQDTNRVNLLMQLAGANYGFNPQNMQLAAEEAIGLSEKLNYKKGTADGYKALGAKYLSTGDFKNAETFFLKSLKISEEIPFYPIIIQNYSNLGSIALIQGKYPEALAYYQKSIRVAEKSKLPQKAAMAYGNMGVIYSEQKKYDLALKHFGDALNMHTLAKYEQGISSSLANLGNVYFNQKEYEKAAEYFNKGLKKDIEINNKAGIATEYGNLASVLSQQNKFQEAFENYSKALKINEEIGNKKGIANNNYGISEYYLKQNKLNEALIYVKAAQKIATEIGLKDVQQNVFLNLSKIYEKQGKMDSAYIYFKKYFDVKETIDNENNRKQISRLEVQYEFDTKEEKYKTQQLLDAENLKQQQVLLALNNAKLTVSNKERDLVRLNFLKTQADLKTEQLESISRKKQLEIAENEVKLKKNEIEIANLNIAAKEKQKWYLVAGLLMLTVIGSLLFYQRNSSQKANQKLQILNTELDEANQAKVRFLGILNHDLRSPVANLIQFLQIQNDTPELIDEATKKRLQTKTMAGAENLLASMEDILLWSKGQMQNFKPQSKQIAINSSFQDIQRHFESQEKVKISFQNPQNIALNTDEDYLKTILRNLTSNAIKALAKTDNATIEWKAWQENGKLYLSITDNGTGANQEQFKALYDDNEVVGIKTGLGLHLIRDLAKAIDCEISVDSQLGSGTVFTLRFENKQVDIA